MSNDLPSFDDQYIVSVVGSVRSPGDFDYGTGITLQDVLLQAGGFTQEAENSKIEVSRVMEYNILSDKLIPKRTIIRTIKIGNDLLLSDEAQAFTLQPMDEIFVRANPDFEPVRHIILSGEVKYPGKYTIMNKKMENAYRRRLKLARD